MAIKILSEGSTAQPAFVEYPAADSTTYTKDTVLYWGSNVLNACDGSTETIETVEAICQETKTTVSSEKILAMPIVDGMFFQADANANTLSTHLGINHNLSAAGTVDNTASDDGSTAGIVKAVDIIGATGDKKLKVRFNRIGNAQ